MLRKSLKSNKEFFIRPKQRQIVLFAAERCTTFCRGCGKTVDLATFAEASEIVGASVDEIIRRAASGAIHIAIRPEALLICLDSLLNSGFDSFQKQFVKRGNQRTKTKVGC